jgi:hypothetical protein
MAAVPEDRRLLIILSCGARCRVIPIVGKNGGERGSDSLTLAVRKAAIFEQMPG